MRVGTGWVLTIAAGAALGTLGGGSSAAARPLFQGKFQALIETQRGTAKEALEATRALVRRGLQAVHRASVSLDPTMRRQMTSGSSRRLMVPSCALPSWDHV